MAEMLKELNPASTIEQSTRALEILLQCDREFKEKVTLQGFGSQEEEIYYFRYQRPALTADIIFHSKRYHIELKKPIGSAGNLQAFYQHELKKIHQFFTENEGFIRYIRSGSTELDAFFFLRNNISYKTVPESSYSVLDQTQTTNFDLKIGKLYACERLAEYLNQCVGNLDVTSNIAPEYTAATPESAKPLKIEDLLLSDEVEQKFRISASTLKRWRYHGKISYIKLEGMIYYDESEIIEMLNRHRHKRFDD